MYPEVFIRHRISPTDKTVNQLATETLDELIRKTCLRQPIFERELHSTSRARATRAEIALMAVEKRIATVSAVTRHGGRSQLSISPAMNWLMDERNKL